MKSELDWSDYRDQGMGDAYADIPKHGGDFAKAVSVCINSGICEQQRDEVMCPSHRINPDSSLSPGGRVKLLKRLLNKEGRPSFVEDDELDAAMDQCVACKGCKRACESNLDMALIKAEYLAQRQLSTGISLRTRLFAYLPFILQRFPLLRHLIRWRNRSSLLRKLGEKWLGIAAAMPLPEMASCPFVPALEAYPPLKATPFEPARHVVLLLDSFTTLFAPQQAEDALKLLRGAGYRVWVIHPYSAGTDRPLDTGRTLLSQGLVQAARREAIRLLDILAPHIHAKHPIIGLEPSTLLMLRDEYKALRLGELATQAAPLAQLFEEFIAREQINGRFNLEFGHGGNLPPMLVHGHCHQKAVGAMKSMRKALRLIAELEVSFIKSSCCGMGGTFGFEAEHIEQSRQMAELSLVPTINARPQAELICNGFGCSHQIYATTGRKPKHLVSVLAAMMA